MDEETKRLAEEVGTAINESVAQSSSVAAAIERLREAGFEMELTLKLEIGLRAQRTDGTTDESSGSLELTAEDVRILQAMKIKIEPENLPCGIAEVRATKTGFLIDFFRPVDRAKAADLTSYSISSYRRESTPAYGGPDLDRRTETINAAEVSADGKRVTLTLPELRRGHVYELWAKNLAPDGEIFHPDEAHYTLNQIPQ